MNGRVGLSDDSVDRCSPCMHEDPSSMTSTHVMARVVVHVCDPALERWQQVDSWAHW